MAALIERGDTVLLPFGVVRYDLAFDRNDGVGIKTVQCKTGKVHRGSVIWSTASTRPYTATGSKHYRGQVDYFGIWCPGVDPVFLVPPEVVPNRFASLRLEPTINGQKKGIRWASDYLLA